ncbi:MAG: sugar phosphate nucleotidyltransferase [Planctomycetota bacterium]
MSRSTLLVLAAGMGSRYGGLKQIDRFGPHGETIVDYSVYDALRAGFGRVVFVIRREFEDAFRRTVGDRYERHLDVGYAYQELDALPAGHDLPAGREKPWGTGHAILVAKGVIHEPFAVVNADDFYGREAYATAAAYLDRAADRGGVADYAMVGYQVANTLSAHGQVSRGVCRVDPAGNLADVEETHGIRRESGRVVADDPAGGDTPVTLGEAQLVSMNFWCFTPSIFAHLEEQFAAFLAARGSEPHSEFYIPSAVNTLVHAGRATARVLACDARWFGVTHREDKPGVESALRERVASGVYPAPLWSSASGDPTPRRSAETAV